MQRISPKTMFKSLGFRSRNTSLSVDMEPECASLAPATQFPVGIETFCSPSPSTVDIVFIHGLTGDREKTWSYKGRDPWPKTLLPQELPTARILTFGYDADWTHFPRAVSKNRIKDHANNLLNALAILRGNDGTTERPIFFVCHSLGGIVCQEALSRAKQWDNAEAHLRQIFDCTRGIVFLGTPHRGAAIAKWGEILARALGYVVPANSKLLSVLTTNSHRLQQIQEDFHALLRNRAESSSKIEITCFYEELSLGGLGVVVPRQSATMDGYNMNSIHQDHIRMTKFANSRDPGFQAVSGELRRWLRLIEASVPRELPEEQPLTHNEMLNTTDQLKFSRNQIYGDENEADIGDYMMNPPTTTSIHRIYEVEGGFSHNIVKGNKNVSRIGNTMYWSTEGSPQPSELVNLRNRLRRP